MEVQRKELTAETVETFDFGDKVVKEFAIKNFTTGNILVCLGDFDEDTSVKIPSMFAENLFDNFNEEIANYTTKTYSKVTVKAEVAGEVEVQCIQ